MIAIKYLSWHFFVAPKNILQIAANYAKAVWHQFLIPQHSRSLFAPWHRRKPSDFAHSPGLGGRAIDAIIDFYIRIIAAGIRLSIIALGLMVEVATLCLFVLLFFVWVLWPLILFTSLIYGLRLILL